MQNMVTYPLYDLDMTEFVPFKDPKSCYLYDLYAVVVSAPFSHPNQSCCEIQTRRSSPRIRKQTSRNSLTICSVTQNHFGTMGGGHYTATVKNERTKEWLYYDDSSVKTYAESEVVTRSAYILFYRRKDLALTSGLNAVVPRLNKTFFAGMPVRTRSGKDCYLIEYREGHPCPFVLGLGDGIVLYLRAEEIVADPDQEDLSSINNMFKSKRKADLKTLEEEEQNAGKRTDNKPKDKERNCRIF